MKNQPEITAGIMDHQAKVSGRLDGTFSGHGFGPVSGKFSVEAEERMITFYDGALRVLYHSPSIKLTSSKDSTFTLFHVTTGQHFHWERKEEQAFEGNLILRLRDDGTISAINEIPLEDYLKSVISSEMNAEAPMEFLKAHAILSRSWILAALDRKEKTESTSMIAEDVVEGQVMRWYDREDHDLFDVCSDDHCQRYQGRAKILSRQAEKAVQETFGRAITFQDEICDARYSKACGGITEVYNTAWGDQKVPYLASVSDASVLLSPIKTEGEAFRWILSEPDVYCNLRDQRLLETVLSDVDRETKNFFRWKVEYPREELETILREKSGVDFGMLKEIVPIHRGPSGRISRLKIVGSKKRMVIGKELEIRRWLSPSHLYSSAFVVMVEGDRFVFHGAGWGHGVGLCQIGAAVMAAKGFTAEEILKHYFSGIKIQKIY